MIFGRMWKYLAGFFALLAPLLYILGKRDGKQKVKANAAIESQKAQERGRKAVAKGRASGLSNDDRVRNNDKWL